MFHDPRYVIGDFFWLRIKAGVKGVQYLTSKRYRRKAREHWRIHPALAAPADAVQPFRPGTHKVLVDTSA